MTAAALVCGSCGTELPPNSKFCNEYGAAVTAHDTHAEYKQVTVLFADVVRSMGIAAVLDMERLREIMTELVERSAAVVQRYGGGSVEYTGDGVMAIFGAPVALEDHAFRACLAALAIQEEANRLAGEVARRDGVALRLRVGLNSGRVIAGEIGSGALGYAAIGEPVGFAQRMESVAPPGGVMLSESTARLVEHTVLLGEPEWVRIKGADEPVRARRLMGIGPRDGLVGRTEASLVGRRWEMAALDALVDRTMSPSVVHDAARCFIWTVEAALAELLFDGLYRLVLADPGGHVNPLREVLLDVFLNAEVIRHDVHGKGGAAGEVPPSPDRQLAHRP